jgi:hypothetical protein
MKFLVRKEARSPYRKGKIIAAQTEDLKPSPRNKRERKTLPQRNPKENKQVRATQIFTHQETNSKAHQSTPGHQQNQIATHQFFMKKNKQKNPQRYIDAQISKKAHKYCRSHIRRFTTKSSFQQAMGKHESSKFSASMTSLNHA